MHSNQYGQIWDTVLTWDNTILVREQLSFLMMLYTFALSEPAFGIARGKETPEDIVLLTEWDQEELEAAGEDVDFVNDTNSSRDPE